MYERCQRGTRPTGIYKVLSLDIPVLREKRVVPCSLALCKRRVNLGKMMKCRRRPASPRTENASRWRDEARGTTSRAATQPERGACLCTLADGAKVRAQ